MTCTITSALRVGLVAGTGVIIAGPVVPAVTTDDIFNPVNPLQTLTDILDGISSAKMVGSAVINATATGNFPLYTVPVGNVFIPTNVVFALKTVSGSGNVPSINLGTSGSFRELIDGTRSSTFDLATANPFAAGTGYAIDDVLTFVGGTHTTSATVTVSKLQLASAASNAAGTVYAPGDTITLSGGTFTSAAIVSVATVKLISATIAAGGTGYGATQTFNVTVAGGTSSQAAVISVTSDGGGIVTTVNSVGTAGSYTVLPALSGNAVTGDNGTDHGTGLTLNLVFGVKAVTVTNPGVYTVTTSSFTQASTSGSGTGATFNTALYGVNTATISNAGDYSVFPSNHIATTGGSGTGCTFDATWGVTASLFSNITAAGQLLSIFDFAATAENTGADYTYIPSATNITARVDAASTYAAYTLVVFLFGFTTSL